MVVGDKNGVVGYGLGSDCFSPSMKAPKECSFHFNGFPILDGLLGGLYLLFVEGPFFRSGAFSSPSLFTGHQKFAATLTITIPTQNTCILP